MSESHPAPWLALYIHWPFCKAKCPYCDFNSHVRDTVDTERWQRALLQELAYFAALMPDVQLRTIFFGGGTPSLMPPTVAAALIERAKQLFPLAEELEITLEANPTSVEAEKFRAFRDAGVNRVSLGVQSLREAQLAFLGREHSAREALAAVELAAQTFSRYSFDLIYALPDQSLADWQAELEEALTYSRGHLSLYQLTIEPGTAFHHLYHARKAFALPPDSLAADLFRLTQDITEEAGYPAYEISNHAAIGQECRHNLAYWTGQAYIGIGPGAHGRLFDGKHWQATQCVKSPERWLSQVEAAGHGIEQQSIIPPAERREEQLITGLRLRAGVTEELAAHQQPDALERLIAQGLLSRQNGYVHATDAGRLVLNAVLDQLLIP